jgi:hypothetical protein
MKKRSLSSIMRDSLEALRHHPMVGLHVCHTLAQLPGIPGWREGGYTAYVAKCDVLMLKALNSVPDDWVHKSINERAALHALITKHARDGKVRVEESGRDCDSVEYSGKVREIDATVLAYYALDKRIGQWADGPFRLAVIPWDAEVQYESRDLALEAYENGHPHHITSRFP